MTGKNLVLVFEAHQGYIKKGNESDFSAENDILFSAISETYIPLLNMLNSLKDENLSFKIALVLSAPLCSLLCDPEIKEQYLEHLEKKIVLGEKELLRCKNKECVKQISECLEFYKKIQFDFITTYKQDIIGKFRSLAKAGYLELIPSAATYAYLPHLSRSTELLNAQVETGLYAHRYFFDNNGEGFWLPHQGWAKGLDKVLRSYGYNYTIVDSRALLFSEKCPEQGIFAPVRSDNSLVIFGSDFESHAEVYGDEGFTKNEIYRNQQIDIAFYLKQEELDPFIEKDKTRIQTGFKYYTQADDEFDEDSILYDSEAAIAQAKEDARIFYNSKLDKLSKAQDLMGGKDACLVCALPAEILGQSWHEGIYWLENLIRISCEEEKLSLVTCQDLIKDQFSLPKVELYPCSSNGLGYGEDLLDNSNSWMYRYIQKASNRIIDLTENFPTETSLKERLLNIGAKEVLLAQSSEWQMMIHDKKLSDYAKKTFTDKIINFTRVFESLASNTVSTEWLTKLERQDSIFPWLNYRIFSKKK